MRIGRRALVVGSFLGLAALLVAALLATLVFLFGPDPRGGREGAGSQAPQPPAAPSHTHQPDGAEDYSGIAVEVSAQTAALVQRAALELASWSHEETVEARRARLAGIVRPDLVGPSPWAQGLAAAPGSYVTSSAPADPAPADPNGPADPASARFAQTIEYTVHLPGADGEETLAVGTASWFFTVDATDPSAPVIVGVVEPSELQGAM